MVKLLFWVRVSVRDRDRTPMFAIALMKLQCPDRGTNSIPLIPTVYLGGSLERCSSGLCSGAAAIFDFHK